MKLHLFAASVLIAASPVFGQGPAPAFHRVAAEPMGHGFGPVRRAVTNAPYSATFTKTSTEKLQDGTTLTRTVTRVAARDSLGRTREEITLPRRGPDATPHTMIMIFDPVARTVTQLNMEKKIATVHALPERRETRDMGRRDPIGPPPAEDQSAASTADATPRPGRPGDHDYNVAVTDLGSKNISGVVATGKRTTHTIPAGVMGNSSPIISTREEWFSPDLKIELSRLDTDPFRGTDTLTVSSLSKAEPAATLFQVPDGYTVESASEHGFGRHGFHRGEGAPPPPPSGM